MEISWMPDGSAGVLVPDRVSTAEDVLDLRDALLAAFADADTVVCDLASAEPDGQVAELAGALVDVATRVAPWSGVLLTVVAAPDAVREALRAHPPCLELAAARGSAAPPARRRELRAQRRLLEPVLRAPALARAFLRETMAGWPADGYRDDALVVVDELVANAVLHAGTEIELRLSLLEDRLGIAVADRAPGRPEVGRPGEGAESGRGMLLVDALSWAWHVLPRRGGGKVIRAVLAAGAHTTAQGGAATGAAPA